MWNRLDETRNYIESGNERLFRGNWVWRNWLWQRRNLTNNNNDEHNTHITLTNDNNNRCSSSNNNKKHPSDLEVLYVIRPRQRITTTKKTIEQKENKDTPGLEAPDGIRSCQPQPLWGLSREKEFYVWSVLHTNKESFFWKSSLESESCIVFKHNESFFVTQV